MGEPSAPAGADPILGPIPRDPPPPPGYVDPLDHSPVLEGLSDDAGRAGEAGRAGHAGRARRAEPVDRAEEQPHTSS